MFSFHVPSLCPGESASSTQWSRDLVPAFRRKLFQEKKSLHFMEPESSLLHLQVPAISPYPETDRPIPCPHIPLPEVTSWYYAPIYARVFQVFSFPQVSPPNSCIHLSSPHMCYMPRPYHSSRLNHPTNIL